MNETIRDFTSVKNKVSEKTETILSKNIDQITFKEFSHLLREKVAIQPILNYIISKVMNIKLDYDFILNNYKSKSQREVLRELVLIDFYYWDFNTKGYFDLKSHLSEKINMLKLPKYITEHFLNYEPNEVEWNEKTIKEYNFFMSDTRVGVLHAYNLILSRKRAIMNGTNVYYDFNNSEGIIKNLNQFEEIILKSINVNNELKELLDSEKQMPTRGYK